MLKIKPQPAQNNPTLPSPPLPQITTTAKRPKPPHTLLTGATLLLLVIILAGILSSCGQTPSQNQTSSPPSHPTPTTPTPTIPKPTIIPTPKATPISAPISSGHDVVMTVTDGLAYIGTADNAVYALRISNGTMLWRYKTNGSVGQKPLVVDGVVYVSAYAGNNGPGTIYALQANDGVLLWHFTGTGDSYIDTPIVENGVAYVASQDGITAFQASNGRQLWHYPTQGYTALSSSTVNGVIYASSNVDKGPGTIYALRASDGVVLWHYTASSSIYLQGILDGVAYADANDGTLAALRLSDGHLLWQRTLDGTVNQFVPENGVIYATTLKITYPTASAPGAASLLQTAIGALLWNNTPNAPTQKTMPLKEGLSSVYALRISDGAILWHYTMDNGGNSFASGCAVKNGIVYASTNVSTNNDTSKSYVYALQGGTILWQDELSASLSNVLLDNGVIYLGSSDNIAAGAVDALQAQNGTLLWSYPIAGPVFEAPILIDGRVYVSAANGMVYALRAGNGSAIWYYLTDVSG